MIPPTRRVWPWTLALGAAAAVLAGIGGTVGYLLLVASLPLALRGHLAGLAGLLVGFGGLWLLLMATQFALGGHLEDPLPWLLVGIVPLSLGALVAAMAIVRAD